MAPGMMPIWQERVAAEDAALDPFDSDAIAGDWFAAAPDPHYAELPFYVSLEDEDEVFGPFSDDTEA